MKVHPEAHALRRVFWQLFVTLTFLKPPLARGESLPRVFAWLRFVAEAGGIHFKKLLWVLRFEIGRRRGRGHYHVGLAGIPRTPLDTPFCRRLESAWWAKGGGLSEVAMYEPTRDGVGYILKLPTVPQGVRLWQESKSGISDTDCEPMLSKSLYPMIRRGRM